MKKHPSICIIGGHLSPAFAVASYVKKTHGDITIDFIGREKSFSTGMFHSVSVERDVMWPVSDSTYLLPIERPGLSITQTVSFIRSFFLVYSYLSEKKPSVVVSFGGYVGLVVGIVAVLKGIPLVIHEQTQHIGRANLFLERWARKFLVSFKEQETPNRIYAGFPLREEFLSPPKKLSFTVPQDKPVLYITGGTTGAVGLNELCFPNIFELLSSFTVVHQTGNVSLAKADAMKASLPKEKKERYVFYSYINPADASWLMHHAAVVISRAGANSVYELAVTKVPSILIPLPASQTVEQQINAQWLKAFAPTEIFSQSETSPAKILSAIKKLYRNTSERTVSFPIVPMDGTQHIVNHILSFV